MLENFVNSFVNSLVNERGGCGRGRVLSILADDTHLRKPDFIEDIIIIFIYIYIYIRITLITMG